MLRGAQKGLREPYRTFPKNSLGYSMGYSRGTHSGYSQGIRGVLEGALARNSPGYSRVLETLGGGYPKAYLVYSRVRMSPSAPVRQYRSGMCRSAAVLDQHTWRYPVSTP
jgi:hypothetical protein